MNLFPSSKRTQTGRRLLVLDQFSVTPERRRRQRRLQKRRRDVIKAVSGIVVLCAGIALIAGASFWATLTGTLIAALVIVVGTDQLTIQIQAIRTAHSRVVPGVGVGARRPEGGFSLTRHRAGAPVVTYESDIEAPKVLAEQTL